VQRRTERDAAGETLGRGLSQPAGQHPVHGGRQAGPEAGQCGRCRVQLGPHHGHVLVPAERRRAGQQLERGTGQRVGVGAPVHLAAFYLLRRQVVQRAEHLAGHRQAGRGVELLADAEVGQVHMVGPAGVGHPAEQHVGRFHVPVHQAAGVRRVQRGRDLADDAEGPGHPQRPSRMQQAVHIVAGHVAHRDVQHPAGLTRIEDRDDVGVVDRRGRPGLPDEPLPERLVLRVVQGQHLERHPAVEPDVAGPVDHRHATPADFLFELVTGDLRARAEID
jgi:hypothetical protein